MFNKMLLASITLDKKKIKNNVEGSCNIKYILRTRKWLTDKEYQELINCLKRATELLRESYVRSQRKF